MPSVEGPSPTNKRLPGQTRFTSCQSGVIAAMAKPQPIGAWCIALPSDAGDGSMTSGAPRWVFRRRDPMGRGSRLTDQRRPQSPQVCECTVRMDLHDHRRDAVSLLTELLRPRAVDDWRKKVRADRKDDDLGAGAQGAQMERAWSNRKRHGTQTRHASGNSSSGEVLENDDLMPHGSSRKFTGRRSGDETRCSNVSRSKRPRRPAGT